MRPIRKGDRGAAVEDVQRRLVQLGVDLGRTGIDGVFLGATQEAVVAFQREHHLIEDGEVGSVTWAALVDATFSLGDRLLYLRSPFLHGADVRTLQRALNSLGFACGAPDGIFGAFTERAVRDFQANVALAADGIVGPGTVRAIEGLRHVWADKTARPPIELRAAPARSCAGLLSADVVLVADAALRGLADRIVNLAKATEPSSRLSVAEPGADLPEGTAVIELTCEPHRPGRLVAVQGGGESLSKRLAGSIAASDRCALRITVVIDGGAADEHAVQALAVALVDGLCMGLAEGF